MVVVTHTASLRAAPDYASRRLGKLHRGEQFESMAQVRNSGWVLVGRDGVGLGYVQAGDTRPDHNRYADRY
jgi:hypothetical protein